MSRVRLAATVVLLGCAIARQALAQPVVLVRPQARDPELTDAFNRLGAELRIHHFDTVVVDAELGPNPASALEAIAREQRAFASIAFVQRDGSAVLDVWLLDRVTGKVSMRSLDVSHSRDAASLIAVRAVDLLRASLQELAPGDKPPQDVVGAEPQPAPEAAIELAAPAEPRWSLAAEAALLAAGSRFGLGLGPMLGVAYRPLAALELGLLAHGTLLGQELDTASGRASVREELCFVEARAPVLRAGRLRVAPALAFGAAFLQAQGQPEQPLIAQSGQVWAALLGLGLHAELRLLTRLSLCASLRALLPAPRLGVAVGRDQARLALAIWQLSTGVAVGL